MNLSDLNSTAMQVWKNNIKK